MIEIGDIILIVLFVLAYRYWVTADKVKAIAFNSAKIHCQKLELQMLDEYVALHRFWFKRDDYGSMKAWRSFVFEFSSTGEARYQGRVIMLGEKVLSIELEPYHI